MPRSIPQIRGLEVTTGSKDNTAAQHSTTIYRLGDSAYLKLEAKVFQFSRFILDHLSLFPPIASNPHYL
jgi:hypothetical protein